MAALGSADTGGTAADRAKAALANGGGGATMKSPATAYQIPIRTGSFGYDRQYNRGQFDDNIHTAGPGTQQHVSKDLTSRFDLTDEGVNAAFGTWYSFDDQKRGDLTKKMWYLGLIKDPHDFDSAYNVWKTAVTHAGRFAMTGKEIDPQDVLDMMGDAANGPGGSGGTRIQGPVTRRQIDLTDPETAKAWVQQAFQQSMGRAPEDAEIRAMVDALGRKEKASPQIQTTTPTKWDDQGNPIDSTTTTTGGVNAQAYLQNQISADPEATAHQAAGELYPALMQALGASL